MNRLIAAAVGLVLPLTASAQVIDQSASGGGLFAQIPQWTAQSFVAGATSLVGGGFQLYASADATGTFTVALYDGAANAGGQLLASGSASYALTGSQAAWVDVSWGPVAVTTGGTYWLYGSGSVQEEAQVYTLFGVNTYANGGIVAVGSSDITATPGPSFPNYDAAFRTFKPTPEVDPDATPVSEPATWALMVMGAVPLGLLTGYRRRT